jgi:hypothetical protein
MLITAQEWSRLDYLHDAKVTAVTWDSSDPSKRQFILDLTCDPESGDELWQGKRLRVILSDVIAAFFQAWGHCAGDEYLSKLGNKISQEMQGKINELSHYGATIPEERFTISFSSGSEIEVVCESISVEVAEGDDKRYPSPKHFNNQTEQE